MRINNKFGFNTNYCRRCQYNFNTLLKSFGVNRVSVRKMIAGYYAQQGIDLNAGQTLQVPGFTWINNSEEQFKSFLQIVSSLKITNEIEKFEKLFDNPPENLAITLDARRPDFILQFLACLKEAHLVSWHGCGRNGSFYRVLSYHVVDFDAVFLKNRTPQRRVNTVKNLQSWHGNRRKFEALFRELLAISNV